MTLTKLNTKIVDKPWGRFGIDPRFGADPKEQIGEIWFEAADGRPLEVMVKYLFTTERLSIQVHPDDATAHARGKRSGKTECWIVLEASDDAELGIGTKRVVAADELIAAARDGSIVDLIDWRKPKVGDFIYNPAGTIHALGAGLTVLEVQQAVDLTYRLYDYGRPRELHLDEARDVVHAEPHHDPLDGPIDRNRTRILADQGPFGLAWCHRSAPPIGARAELQLLPIDAPMTVDGTALNPGECGLYDGDPAALTSTGNFVLAWSREG